MPYNGTGTFVRPFNWQNDKNNGINITASRMDGDSDGFAQGLSNCITKDGQQTTTARIPFAAGLSFTSGTAMSTSINLAGDITTGIYSSAAGAIDIASSGARVGGFTAAGLDNTVIGAGTAKAASFTTIGASGASTLAAVTATTLNKVTVTAPASAATFTLADGSSLVTSGANSITLTSTGSTNVTLPTSGTLISSASVASTYAPLASPTFTGVPAAPTASAATSTTQLATTAFVNSTALTLATGTTAVTQSASDNSTKVATTAYVDRAAPAITALGVGSIILALNNTSTLAANATTSASNLVVYRFNAAGTLNTTTGDSITGTWKALQTVAGAGFGLFLRTA